MEFIILIDNANEFKWKLQTPWGIIEIYSGGLVENPFKEQGLAEYLLAIHIESYRKYMELI